MGGRLRRSPLRRRRIFAVPKSRRDPFLAIGSADALACKGGVLADRGDFAAAHLCFSEAMELLDGSTHPVGNSVRNWIAIAYIWQSKWQDAERVATESIRIAENTRALLLLAISRGTAGYAAWDSIGAHDALADLIARGYLVCMGEHTKNARPSTKGTHEKGKRDKARKRWDKKRQHEDWKNHPGKK